MVVEILKIVVWPIVLLLIYFSSKKDFSNLIRRVNKASILGNEIAISQEQPKNMVDNERFETEGKISGRNFYDSFGIIKELEKEAWQIYNDQPEPERLGRIINVAAFENFVRRVQWIYIYIYGSQIEFLELMSSKFPIAGLPKSESIAFFNEVKGSGRFAGHNIEFNEWVGFLINFKLVREENSNYYLEGFGRALLVFIIENKLIKNKGL
ncbi:hypothetical protein [Serratia liquefaciens]|uniref:hypothetical protein n=1 Tax=Serratia liquefaciens TaxID=614 RepID=UPI002361E870|nr:hypothetical protein [Serratia liquefaciens]